MPPVPCSHPRMAQQGTQLEHPTGRWYPTGTQQPAAALGEGAKDGWIVYPTGRESLPNSANPTTLAATLVG
jgi:hypothetical protein